MWCEINKVPIIFFFFTSFTFIILLNEICLYFYIFVLEVENGSKIIYNRGRQSFISNGQDFIKKLPQAGFF